MLSALCWRNTLVKKKQTKTNHSQQDNLRNCTLPKEDEGLRRSADIHNKTREQDNYYKRTKERQKQYSRDYYKDHKINVLKRTSRRYSKYRDVNLKQGKERYKKNRLRRCKQVSKYRRVNREKVNAWGLLNYRNKTKRLFVVRNCQICGSNKSLDKHHPDYSKPFEFIVICRSCHNKVHSGSLKW